MKRAVAITVIISILIYMTGCASVPEKKYLDRMSEEDRKTVQKGIELNRGIWQAGSFGAGLWAGYGDGTRTDTKSVAITMSMTSLSFMGIASLCNIHTYRENDPEKTGLFYGLLLGAAAGAAFSSVVIQNNLNHPNQFMFLPVLAAPYIIISVSLAGGGLGAAVGKLFAGDSVTK